MRRDRGVFDNRELLRRLMKIMFALYEIEQGNGAPQPEIRVREVEAIVAMWIAKAAHNVANPHELA